MTEGEIQDNQMYIKACLIQHEVLQVYIIMLQDVKLMLHCITVNHQ